MADIRIKRSTNKIATLAYSLITYQKKNGKVRPVHPAFSSRLFKDIKEENEQRGKCCTKSHRKNQEGC